MQERIYNKSIFKNPIAIKTDGYKTAKKYGIIFRFEIVNCSYG